MKLAIITVIAWLSFNAFLIVRFRIAEALIEIARRRAVERRNHYQGDHENLQHPGW